MNKLSRVRYRIQLSYLGTHYHGWQKQLDNDSVQSQINAALSTALQELIDVVGAGRTDTGVHASVYIAHFDTDQVISDIDNLIFKLNSLLPNDIAVQDVKASKEDFHARFDAISRTYQYSIIQSKDPFLIERSYFIRNILDINAMQKASNLLYNHKNFKSFSKVKTDVYTFDCEVKKAIWFQEGHHLLFEIEANRFLRNMVRAIVGTLIEVGLHKISVEEFNTVILSQDRSKAGKSVPANALVLKDIKYPEPLELS